MAVLGGFDDDVWFGLQNSQHHFNNNNNYGFANQNINDNNNMGLINNYVNHNTNQTVSINLESQLALQQQELDLILHLHNEKLRIALHEQRKQQVSSLVKNLETRARSVMKQKDEDLARATRKGLELQTLLSKAESESQAWQRIARANEATIVDLNNTLEKALLERQTFLAQNDTNSARNDNGAAEDAVSSCFGSSEELLATSANDNKWVCKKCNARSSCVVFVPCKHLCSCKACEAFLGSCPVCGSTKEASIEVFLT